MTLMAMYPPSGPYTVADLEAMPDDGRRYELIDGMLHVSPAPGDRHQRMVLQLAMRLEQVCPDDLLVYVAPFAVQPAHDTEVQPDVLVARDEDVTEKNLPVAPVLAVEILSPSTTLYDLNTKKAVYERMGVPDYWIIDPLDPRLTAFQLDETGRYQLIADVKGDDAFNAEHPFQVRVAPAELLGRMNHSR
jgi:Uma2 family endonuclease